jgi:death-on-curing protein
MRYLTLGEVVALHRAILESSGGASGIRDIGALESALAQPRASFGTDLHQSLHAKAAALSFSLAMNHPFADGNKRAAHAAMEVFLILNAYEIAAPVDEQERLMLDLAAGKIKCE